MLYSHAIVSSISLCNIFVQYSYAIFLCNIPTQYSYSIFLCNLPIQYSYCKGSCLATGRKVQPGMQKANRAQCATGRIRHVATGRCTQPGAQCFSTRRCTETGASKQPGVTARQAPSRCQPGAPAKQAQSAMILQCDVPRTYMASSDMSFKRSWLMHSPG